MYFYAFLTKTKSHNCYFQFVLARWCVGVHASNAFDTSVLKVREIELTTIISDGSRTMHSHPRRRLPADRFPKLEKGGKREILNLYLKPA